MKNCTQAFFCVVAVALCAALLLGPGYCRTVAPDNALWEYKNVVLKDILTHVRRTINSHDLVVVVQIARDGRQAVSKLTGKPILPFVAHGSGDEQLDVEVIQTISTMRFPPLPASYRKKVLKLAVDFGDTESLLHR